MFLKKKKEKKKRILIYNSGSQKLVKEQLPTTVRKMMQLKNTRSTKTSQGSLFRFRVKEKMFEKLQGKLSSNYSIWKKVAMYPSKTNQNRNLKGGRKGREEPLEINQYIFTYRYRNTHTNVKVNYVIHFFSSV